MPESHTECNDIEVHPRVNKDENVDDECVNVPDECAQSGVSGTLPDMTECKPRGKATETVIRRYPLRNRRLPSHLQEFETEDAVDKLITCVNFCYRAVCDIPQTYQDAIVSSKSKQWKNAMDEEMR